MTENNVSQFIASTEQRLTNLEESMKHNHDAHKDIYTRIEETSKAGVVIDVRYSTIIQSMSSLEKSFAEVKAEVRTEINNIKAQVQELMLKPAKKWDSVVMGAMLAIVGAVIGYFIK